MRKIRKGDPVVVISGKYKGEISTIEKVIDGEYVIVAGVNEVKKATKGQGFVTKTLPLHISNVQYYLSDKKQGTRLSIVEVDGKKKRKSLKFDVVVD